MNKYFIFVVAFFLIGNVVALSETAINVTLELDDAYKDVLEVSQRGIGVLRINESYTTALEIFESQKLLEKNNRNPDYSLVRKYISEVKSIKEIAILSNDQLEVFLHEYSSMNSSLDLSEMDELYLEIVTSFEDERFEETINLIPKGYESMTSIQSSQTALNIFYDSTRSRIADLFFNTWKYLLSLCILFLILWFIFKKSIKRFFISKKISRLESRRKSIKYLMEMLQKEYFDSKRISEGEYSVKMKSFSDMVLDINRRILLLKEELERMNGIKKQNKSVKKISLKK